MSKPKIHRLGDLQLRIMKLLWQHQESTVSDMHERLRAQGSLAYTTIATMLQKMEGRGLVSHRAKGRSFLYAAKVAAEEVSRSMANHLVDRLFEGSLLATVNHLLSSREVSRDELRQLEKLIASRKKKR